MIISAFASKTVSPSAPPNTFSHEVPPSVVLQTPVPFTSPVTYDSPVPTYHIIESFGSIAIQEIAKFSGISTKVQTDPASEIFVFFHRPPLTPPA